MRRHRIKEEKLKRGKRLTLMLNDREMRAIDIYCKRYRIKNKSRFLRETVMNAILKKFDQDLPSLFEEIEPDLFSPVGSDVKEISVNEPGSKLK